MNDDAGRFLTRNVTIGRTNETSWTPNHFPSCPRTALSPSRLVVCPCCRQCLPVILPIVRTVPGRLARQRHVVLNYILPATPLLT